MMTRRRSALLVLWAIAIVAVAGAAALQGCAHEDKSPQAKAQVDVAAYQKRVREVVKDPARADQVITLVDELQGQFEQLRANLVQSRSDLAKLDADYYAKR